MKTSKYYYCFSIVFLILFFPFMLIGDLLIAVFCVSFSSILMNFTLWYKLIEKGILKNEKT